jgi:hypothetical protein
MLEVIKKLDSGTIRGLIVATIPLLVLLGSFFGVDEAVFKANLEGWGEKLVALASLAGVAWAAYARVFKPTPPLTETAAKATQDMIQSQGKAKQGGMARAGMLALILALSLALPAVLAMQGCTTLGVPVAQGWNERLAGGYSAVTAVRETASVLLEGKVRAANAEPDPERRSAMLATAKADAQNLQDQADKAREALDVAKTMRGVNFEAAEERLTSTLRILEALQDYLKEENP